MDELISEIAEKVANFLAKYVPDGDYSDFVEAHGNPYDYIKTIISDMEYLEKLIRYHEEIVGENCYDGEAIVAAQEIVILLSGLKRLVEAEK